MAVEAKRGCGYREAGGIYLVTSGLGEPCERLPVPLECCPTCGEGVRQTRAFRWIKSELMSENARACDFNPKHCPRCPICQPVLLERHAEPKDSMGLLWVGEKFYPTVEDWGREAAKLGVSKRIAAIPKGLVVGKTWIAVGHPRAIRKPVDGQKDKGELFDDDKVKYGPGIFHAFVPERVEVVVTPSMEKEDWVQHLVEKQGATVVRVPENDPDHAPRQRKKSARKESMERVAGNAAKRGEKKPRLRRAQ